jgi:predicted CoA-substrate-specific enzyme activase
MKPSTTSIGFCLGASTISMARITVQSVDDTGKLNHRKNNSIQVEHAEHPHEGNPKAVLEKVISGIDWNEIDHVAVTGRKFRHLLNMTSVAEPEAAEYAYGHIKPDDRDCPALICAGGETFMVYVLDNGGKVTNVLTGNKCAAGTGEFFLQQLRRMDVSLEEAAQWSTDILPYDVSGRCSVFCKSDCTHATNKGIPKSRVTAGLGQMMANKVLELLKKVNRHDLMLVGGTARNQMMVRYLERAIDGLIVPKEAAYFEALGTALWALDHPTRPFPGMDALFAQQSSRLDRLPPLSRFAEQVTFKTMDRDQVRTGDVCLLGLDVGSTTTKAALVRRKDRALLASVYLRTNGDPVGASRQCYRAIRDQVAEHTDPGSIEIVGLGVCGSGRQIAGLHALTDGVINEIIAHATAAVYFDQEVDTIFEIGGQDAKYTYITNGVPSDYAMNEACSAGTGSFLEESALETLAVPMEAIADRALKGDRPPNFNDQCAAFIASDIKNAVHDGVSHDNIVAGLVYSICMNYNNRVKGNRPMGKKVFMQGGVCYNRAVPMAMAALIDKPIIVPPEPGLMGAFGAALEVDNRLTAGLMQLDDFDLETLAEREVSYEKPFVCKGGKEKCDRRCEIARIHIAGQTYPFGGACNRYDNLRRKKRLDVSKLDLVRIRRQLIFEKFAPAPLNPDAADYRGRVGFNRSFLVNTYYPLYAHFFSTLGYQPVLPDYPDPEGIDQRNAPFCYPAELAHGFFHDLIGMQPPPEVLFLPHFKSVPNLNGAHDSQVCPLVQGETFYLQTTFRRRIRKLNQQNVRIFAPLIDLTHGIQGARKPLVETAMQMGVSRRKAETAFGKAKQVMERCHQEMLTIGRQALEELADNPDRIAVVIFSRPYSGLVPEANMGVPHKFASRGIMALPLDFLDPDIQSGQHDYMYWGMGQRILATAELLRRHPQLFGTYITNFSCGPDSFLVGYFRDVMERKPSLTLELDSHSADAGLETRIEAFLDIVHAYRQLNGDAALHVARTAFQPARLESGKKSLNLRTSDGRLLAHNDPRVTLLIPSMGTLGTQAVAQTFKFSGFNVHPHEPSNDRILKLGRGHTSCKECLPLILTTGTLIDYVQNIRRENETVIYFMPTGSGPCRFGQYRVFMEKLVAKLQIPDVTLFSLSSEDGYRGLSSQVHRRAWCAVVISDVCEDMRAMLLANARRPEEAELAFHTQYRLVLNALGQGSYRDIDNALSSMAKTLAGISLKQPRENVPTVFLTGEIFVRRDSLSRRNLTEYLAARGFASICAPVAEWIIYSNWLLRHNLSSERLKGLKGQLGIRIKNHIMRKDELRIKKLLAASGLIHADTIDVETMLNTAEPFISPKLGGEAVLTVGSSMKDVAVDSCGVIAIGPFGCMPNRLSEAILNETMRREDKLACQPDKPELRATLTDVEHLPFLAIESDGSPFPQLIEAKLEAFCLRARRLHERMLAHRYAN